MIWCPYTDAEIEASATTPEHIIPLALGGSNAFTVPVDAKYNSIAGLEIDGPLSNDFSTLIRRRKFDVRGHSGRPPEAIVRKAKVGASKRPAQVTFRGKEGISVWDAIENRYLRESEFAEQPLSLVFEIKWFIRLRFLAKVALSSGFEFYGDLFRDCADHNALRMLMRSKTSDEASKVVGDSKLRGYYEFSEINNRDASQVKLEKGLCEAIPGSCITSQIGADSIFITVGVLGQWIGTLNIPAKTENFPINDKHDLGHAVLLVNGNARKFSYRDFMRYVLHLLDTNTEWEPSR